MSRFHSKSKRRRERKVEIKAARRLQEPKVDIRWRQVPGDLLRWGELISAHRSALARKITVSAGFAIAAFVIGLLLAPLMIEFIFTGRSAAARVNGEELSLSEFARASDFARYRATRDLNALAAYRDALTSEDEVTLVAVQQAIEARRIDLLTVDFQAVDDLITGRLLQEKAQDDGYELPAAELDAEREAVLSSAGAFPAGITSPPDGADDRPLPVRVDEMLANLGLDRDTFEDILIGAVLNRHYVALAQEGVPDRLPQAHLRYIIAPSQEAGDAVVSRYRAGENWEELAQELSTPARDLVDGGDLGFVPVDLFDSRYSEAARDLDEGQVSEPQAVGAEFYVILLIEWDDDRVLTSEQRDRLETNAESDFRTQLFEAAEVEYLLTADGLEWAERHGLRNVGELDPAAEASPFQG
jgi:parvulin-like peptidyl-prolyl isomerase